MSKASISIPSTPLQRMGYETVMLGMGCFWGAEKKFWEISNINSTQVGFAGGKLANPSYDAVCRGDSGHAEVVQIVFDPKTIPFSNILTVFWESHDPTQGNRQGNDIGSQYRSVIYTSTDAQLAQALASRDAYQSALGRKRPITTEIRDELKFYPAEEYHQQYLKKNPGGYCGLKGSDVSCPLPSMWSFK